MINRRCISIFIAPMLFAFFFLYLFWAKPASILSQEYLLAGLFLEKNIFIIIVAIGFGVFLIFTALGFFVFPKLLDGVTLFLFTLVFIMVAYRYILPYNYNGFTDNLSGTPRLSLLGFSRWYYLLDVIFLCGIPALAFLLYRKGQLYVLSTLLMLFCVIEFFTAISSFKFGKNTSSTFSVQLSNNHPNVLVIIYDALSTVIGIEYFTKLAPESTRQSIKDFTLYDNFISPAVGHTLANLPMMFGGNTYSEQQQFALREKKKIEHLPVYIQDASLYFSDKAMISLVAQASANTTLHYRHFGAFMETTNDSGEITCEHQNNAKSMIPIFYVPLYSYVPYFMRKYLADDFQWKHSAGERWLSYYSSLNITSVDTAGSTIEVLHNDGAHTPHASPLTSKTIFTAKSIEDINEIFKLQLDYNTASLAYIIKRLKELEVYDNTKIIVLSDHGFSEVISKDPHISKGQYPLKAIERIDPLAAQYYARGGEANVPAFLMVKDLATTRSELAIDSRFLAIPDIPGIILSTVNSNPRMPDYVKTTPPKRYFTFPIIPDIWSYDMNNMGDFYKELTNNYLKDGNITLINFYDGKTGTYTTTDVPYTSFSDLPDVEQSL
ncbi:MAG: hypothetical protein ACRCY4_08965 [Brevinema sp.]